MFTVTGNSTLQVSNGNFSGVIEGDADLIKNGSGTLTLTGRIPTR